MKRNHYRQTSLSVKGQVVIPQELREAMDLRPGTKFSVGQNGSEIILKPLSKNSADVLYGCCKGMNLLADLKREHRRELKRDIRRT